MKMTKKMSAMMLTLAMTAAGPMAAYASAQTPTVSATQEVKTADGTAAMELTGTIKVTTLSVTIPTTVSFDLDMTAVPEKSATTKDKVNVQVTGPNESEYRIINNSASSVWVYVTDVTPSATAANKTPALVNKYSDLKTSDYNLLFAIKDTAVTPPAVNAYTSEDDLTLDSDKTTFWMKSGMTSGEKYYLNDKKGLLVAKNKATSGENEMGLTIYAFTRKGWIAGDDFKVTPTFTVAVEEPK